LLFCSLVRDTSHMPANFDLVRITKAKKEVDVSTTTIRQYGRQGLAIYKRGKAAYFSKLELADFIRRKAA
jgi:hypothetical protein